MGLANCLDVPSLVAVPHISVRFSASPDTPYSAAPYHFPSGSHVLGTFWNEYDRYKAGLALSHLFACEYPCKSPAYQKRFDYQHRLSHDAHFDKEERKREEVREKEKLLMYFVFLFSLNFYSW